MRFSIINTIFKKEIKEVLRDKRMVYLVILMPFFLYPVLFTIIGKVTSSQEKKINQEKVTVLINAETKSSPLYTILESDTTLIVKQQDFTKESLDTMRSTIGLKVLNDASTAIASGQPVEVEIYANSTKDLLNSRSGRIKKQIEILNQSIVSQRLSERELSNEFLTPVQVNSIDLAPPAAQMGKLIGRFIPMILLFFIFTGIIYIAIDITAGEKERRTLQTLFVSPIKVPEIIGGKFLAVFAVGVVSALMNLLSLILAFFIQAKLMGAGDMSGLSFSISAQGWFWLIILILLSTIIIGGLTLAVVVLANSYKESQSYVTPLMMLLLLPAIFASQPGMELTTTTALIPIVNIFLAMGEVFVGIPNPMLMSLVAFMALLYAGLALFLASVIFGNENVVTGQKVDMKKLFSRN